MSYFKNDKNVAPVIKISEDFKTTVLCSGAENYILRKGSGNDKSWHQSSLVQFAER